MDMEPHLPDLYPHFRRVTSSSAGLLSVGKSKQIRTKSNFCAASLFGYRERP